MNASRVLLWIVLLVVVVVVATRIVRVPDPRRYVRDAAGRLVEIRHASTQAGASTGGRAA